jgi:hypothetical protein
MEIILAVADPEIEKSWRRNAWCYITTVPGLPVAFISSSIILTPIFGPYGGYAWFPPNVLPIVTIETKVTAKLSLGPLASTEITGSASSMCKLRRSWIQLGRIDHQWFSTVLGGDWDKDYSTDKAEWTAFFRSEDAQEEWQEIEKIAFHNIACRAVAWLEEIFNKIEEGW